MSLLKYFLSITLSVCHDKTSFTPSAAVIVLLRMTANNIGVGSTGLPRAKVRRTETTNTPPVSSRLQVKLISGEIGMNRWYPTESERERERERE